MTVGGRKIGLSAVNIKTGLVVKTRNDRIISTAAEQDEYMRTNVMSQKVRSIMGFLIDTYIRDIYTPWGVSAYTMGWTYCK